MTHSEAIDQIATAAAKAQKVLKHAVKDAENPHYRSKYANEAAVRDAARVFADEGIAVFQNAVTAETGVEITTFLAHSSGQWIKFDPFLVPLSKRDAHGVGSATTYAKRYALSAALGIAADEDDDGNDAVGKKKKETATAPTSRPIATEPRADGSFRVLEVEANGDKPWAASLADANGEVHEVTIWSEPVRNLAVDCAQDQSAVDATINKSKQLTKLKRRPVEQAPPIMVEPERHGGVS